MNVPKWLIPVISVVAALAVGVALAFVGANFASKVVADTPAKSSTVPVLGPVASGLTTAQAAGLDPKKLSSASKVVGSQTVVEPGAVRKTTSVQQAVDALVSHAPTGTPTPAPTPTSTALPDSSSVGVVRYDSDPCAPTNQKPPAGCPAGALRGAIFADTAPPALDFSIQPFTGVCGTTATPTGVTFDNGDAVVLSVPILLQPTVPANFTVHFSSNLSTEFGVQSGDTRVRTDPATVTLWNAAVQGNTPVGSLPPLRACLQVQGLAGALVHVWITAATLDGQVVQHDLLFQSDGTPTLPEVQVQTFVSHDYFVAYSETSATKGLVISAYDMTRAPGVTCADASHLTRIPAGAERSGGMETTPGTPAVLLPHDFTIRRAVGFTVAPGSVTLVCAGWYRGREVPSFDRTTPYRVSSSVVHAPDAQIPWMTAFYVGLADIAQNGTSSTVRDITLAGSTVEGIPCGSADVYVNGEPTIGHGHDFDRFFCEVPISALDSATDDPTLRGNLVVTTTMTTYGNVRHTSQFTIAPFGPDQANIVCDDCDVLPQETFEVPLPGVSGGPSYGEVLVNRGYDRVGTSHLHSWVVNPGYSDDAAIVASEPGAPQLNTDEAITIDGARSTPTQVMANFNLLADQPTAYTVKLSSLDGSPACVLAHGVTQVTGNFTGTAAVPISFTGLCFNTIYLASVTLTNSHGTTQWGWQSGNTHWPRYLIVTPQQRFQATLQLTVRSATAHHVQDGLSVTFDGHVLDGAGSGFPTCAANETENYPVVTMATRAHPVLHLTYQVRPGNQTGTGTAIGCTFIAGTIAAPVSVDLPVDIAAVLAHPAGVHYVSGPLNVLVKLTPVP